MFWNKTKKSASRKVHKIRGLLDLSKKVINYRSDILSKDTVFKIIAAEEKIRELLKKFESDNSHSNELDSACNDLTALLKNNGGIIFNSTFLSENIETLLVAAIIAIGIRSFFLQPFRIPTGSMFPSFSGMQTKIYSSEELPSGAISALRWFTHGASGYQLKAPCDGIIRIPMFNMHEAMQHNSYVRFSLVHGRELFGLWFTSLLPKAYRLYSFEIGKETVSVRVPFEFNGMESLITRAFFGQKYKKFEDVLKNQNNFVKNSQNGRIYLNTNKYFKKDENVLAFEILAGDMLLVDKVSYNFRKPKVGEPIVFKTKNIPKLGKDLYYIKRLVGISGDVLKIDDTGTLFRNGKVITGSIAFDLNNSKQGLYPGYVQSGNLSNGESVKVPEKLYYALGDNSPYSGDSRYWDFVPEREVVGHPVLVLHPFSWRWGAIEKDKSNKSANKNDFVF